MRQKSLLLQTVRAKARVRRLSPRTERAYVGMELIPGPQQLRAANSTGNVAIDRLHHAESELPHVVAPPQCGV